MRLRAVRSIGDALPLYWPKFMNDALLYLLVALGSAVNNFCDRYMS